MSELLRLIGSWARHIKPVYLCTPESFITIVTDDFPRINKVTNN